MHIENAFGHLLLKTTECFHLSWRCNNQGLSYIPIAVFQAITPAICNITFARISQCLAKTSKKRIQQQNFFLLSKVQMEQIKMKSLRTIEGGVQETIKHPWVASSLKELSNEKEESTTKDCRQNQRKLLKYHEYLRGRDNHLKLQHPLLLCLLCRLKQEETSNSWNL